MDCPICRDTDELCSHTAPAPAQAAPWSDARPANLADALARIESLEILVLELRGRVGALEDARRRSETP